MSDLDALHAIFVPVGGGGLIAGIAAYVKALKPGIEVIGVEPTGAAHTARDGHYPCMNLLVVGLSQTFCCDPGLQLG